MLSAVILEPALLPVKPGGEVDFDSAFAQAEAIIAGTLASKVLALALSGAPQHLPRAGRVGPHRAIRRASAAHSSTSSGSAVAPVS
jgi:hypothetical protein